MVTVGTRDTAIRVASETARDLAPRAAADRAAVEAGAAAVVTWRTRDGQIETRVLSAAQVRAVAAALLNS